MEIDLFTSNVFSLVSALLEHLKMSTRGRLVCNLCIKRAQLISEHNKNVKFCDYVFFVTTQEEPLNSLGSLMLEMNF